MVCDMAHVMHRSYFILLPREAKEWHVHVNVHHVHVCRLGNFYSVRVHSRMQSLKVISKMFILTLQEDKSSYIAAPPTYSPIRTAHSTNNIQDFISMKNADSQYGKVLTYEQLVHRFSTND